MKSLQTIDRRGGEELESLPRMREIGVRSPVSTDRDDHYKRYARVAWCGMLKNPHCLMAMSAEHRSKFAALHRQW